MSVNGEVRVQRRWSRAEADRLVQEFEQSGMGRKDFSVLHGLCVHTLDAWRKRIAQSKTQERLVPVEIVEDDAVHRSATRGPSVGQGGRFRIVLSQGLRIEVEPGFDAAELRRLMIALDRTYRHADLSHVV